MKKVNPKRGEIYLVNFDPTHGAEIKKTRPALIVQNNIANQHSPVTIVAAITSFKGGKVYPTEVIISSSETGLREDSMVVLNQIRSIDRQHLMRKLGIVQRSTMQTIDTALQLSLGLVSL